MSPGTEVEKGLQSSMNVLCSMFNVLCSMLTLSVRTF